MEYEIPAAPHQTISLEFSCNFYVKDAKERGEDRLFYDRFPWRKNRGHRKNRNIDRELRGEGYGAALERK